MSPNPAVRSSSPSNTTAPTTSAGSVRPTGVSIQGLIEDALARVRRRAGDRPRRRAHRRRRARARAGRERSHARGARRRHASARAERRAARSTSASSASRMPRRTSMRASTPSRRPTNTGSSTRRMCRRSCTGTCGTCPGALDVDAMRAGAAALLGRHDFAAFQRRRRRRGRHAPTARFDRVGADPKSGLTGSNIAVDR